MSTKTDAGAPVDPVALITEIGERVNDLAPKSEVEALRAEVAEIKKASAPRTTVPWSQQGDNKNRKFQYRKLIRKIADQTRGVDTPWEKFGGEFERDAIQEGERNFGACRVAGGDRASTLVTNSNTLGGYLVPDVMGGYSDILRARNPIFSKFGTEIINTNGMPFKYNRMATGATMTATAEGGAITQTDVAFEQDQYFPKKYTGYIAISTESIMMDDPSIESTIQGELAGRASVNVATQFLTGTGVAGNPTGIFVDSRISTYSTNVNPLTTAGLMGMIETLKTNNALLDGSKLGFIMHPLMESAVMGLSQSGTGSQLLFNSGAANYASEGLGIFGIPYATTTVLGGTEDTADIGLVDWSQVALLRWGALEISSNPNVQWLNDNLVIRVIDRFNVLIKQPKAIVFSTSSGKA